MKEGENNPLGSKSIKKLLLQFSIPSVIAMVVNSIYNIVDQIFIQRSSEGSLGNQATTVAFPMITLTLALALLIGNGASAMASIRMGEKKNEEANKILGNAFMSIIAVSLFFTIIVLIFFEPFLNLLGATPDVMPYAKKYVSIVLCGTVFMAIGSGLSGFIRIDGAPRVSMISLVIGCVLNVILDPIFIFACDMGVSGAALGTIISQLVTAIITMWYLLFKGKIIRLNLKKLKLDIKLIMKFCFLGVSSFVTQFANALVQISLNNLLVHYGDLSNVGGNTAQTAMGIVLKTNMLLIGISVGIGTGAQPILGYNKGAGLYDRVKKTYIYSVVISTTISTIGWIFISFFPHIVLSIYGNNDPEMIDFAGRAMRIFLGLVCVSGFNIVSSNYFQATGRAGAALIMAMSRQVIALIPLLFILSYFMGLDGILYAGLFADIIAFIIGVCFVITEMKKINRLIKIQFE